MSHEIAGTVADYHVKAGDTQCRQEHGEGDGQRDVVARRWSRCRRALAIRSAIGGSAFLCLASAFTGRTRRQASITIRPSGAFVFIRTISASSSTLLTVGGAGEIVYQPLLLAVIDGHVFLESHRDVIPPIPEPAGSAPLERGKGTADRGHRLEHGRGRDQQARRHRPGRNGDALPYGLTPAKDDFQFFIASLRASRTSAPCSLEGIYSSSTVRGRRHTSRRRDPTIAWLGCV